MIKFPLIKFNLLS